MFLSHKNSIPKNSYIVLPQYQNKKILVSGGEYSLVSNICPHQKSLISLKDGAGNRTCPYHSWSFDIKGNPITSGRTGHYCKNQTALDSNQCYEWNGLIFSSPVDFDINIDFTNMQLVEQRIDKVNTRWENILDLFLDVDHIPGVHAGVYERINLPNITSVDWKFYQTGNMQTVKKDNKIGACWLTLYPNTMIEWQPGSLFITVAVPANENNTDVVVYKYRDADSSDDLWNLNSDVWETAWQQDKNQAQIITEFADKNLEDSKKHFRNWLKNGTDQR